MCSVYVEGEGNTLKHVVDEGEFVRLVARNADYPDQRVLTSSVAVQGVLVAALAIQTYR